ncbi:hypothetical protein HMPREF0262_03591 [Clostridium sp. ATCC 29733]|nr:hypothetical protein HMPREF0262_03591 [Clostridium sp. ATCC 29733]
MATSIRHFLQKGKRRPGRFYEGSLNNRRRRGMDSPAAPVVR